MNIKQALLFGIEILEKKSDHPSRDASLLLSHILKHPSEYLYLHPERGITPEDLAVYSKLLKRRANYEPVAYILGYKEFMGLRFKVDQRVLIPRPETEILVETALGLAGEILAENMVGGETSGGELLKAGKAGAFTVCDIGCGSGAIGLSMLKLQPGISKMLLTDVSQGALELAAENARLLELAKAEFLLGDGLNPLKLKSLEGEVDMILSNPPYIPEHVIDTLEPQIKCFEPRIALDGGRLGTDHIHRLIFNGPVFLKHNGYMILEIGHDQADICKEAFSQLSAFWSRWWPVCDYSGIERVFVAQRS